jgi:hypothetical protein
MISCRPLHGGLSNDLGGSKLDAEVGPIYPLITSTLHVAPARQEKELFRP